jgi:hypothetical protein
MCTQPMLPSSPHICTYAKVVQLGWEFSLVIYPGSTPVGNATLVVANVLTCNKYSQKIYTCRNNASLSRPQPLCCTVTVDVTWVRMDLNTLTCVEDACSCGQSAMHQRCGLAAGHNNNRLLAGLLLYAYECTVHYFVFLLSMSMSSPKQH